MITRKYVDVQKLFQTAQEVDEKVDAYFIRMRNAARCLDLSDEMVRFAIIGGLKANIKQFFIQNAPTDLNEALRCARIAEASATADPTADLLEKVLRPTAANALKHEAALKQLTSQLSALNSPVSSVAERNAGPESTHWQSNLTNQDRRSRADFDRNSRPAFYRDRPMRPQQIQRQNYVNRNYNQNNGDRQCLKCGLKYHDPGVCFANNVRCRICNLVGHYARMCRTARKNPY